MKYPDGIKPALPLLLAGAFLLGGCVHQNPPPSSTKDSAPAAAVGTEIVVPSPPPMPVVETMSMTPGPGFVWIPGAWAWRTQWVWDRGHWAHPPQPDALWVSPQYENRGNVQVFTPGGWKY